MPQDAKAAPAAEASGATTSAPEAPAPQPKRETKLYARTPFAGKHPIFGMVSYKVGDVVDKLHADFFGKDVLPVEEK